MSKKKGNLNRLPPKKKKKGGTKEMSAAESVSGALSAEAPGRKRK